MYVVTLRGSALMLDPRDCVDNDGCLKPLDEINTLYQSYWHEVSAGTLEELPDRRFKRDGLIGGFQAWKYRYSPVKGEDELGQEADLAQRIARQKGLPYNPTLVVEAGSVFVLRVVDGKNWSAAREVIAQWLAHGLPCPEWAKKAYGDTHHTNIFLPQNGFGEIDVNLDCHRSSYTAPLANLERMKVRKGCNS